MSFAASAPPSGVAPSPSAVFLRRALADQAHVGAIAPTSLTLAGRMARLIPDRPGLRVLELGAGTGAISGVIAERLPAGAVHLALDRDPDLLAVLKQTAPSAIPVTGDAADLREHLAARDLGGVDVVLSSLPWSNFDATTQGRIVDTVRSSLSPAGVFATIAYRPTRLRGSSRRFRRLLDASFRHVAASATTWANLPPARLIVAHGPRRG